MLGCIDISVLLPSFDPVTSGICFPLRFSELLLCPSNLYATEIAYALHEEIVGHV